MAIEIHNIVTNSGYLSSFYDKLNFLTEEEIKEFNCIGYSGKNSKGEEYENTFQFTCPVSVVCYNGT